MATCMQQAFILAVEFTWILSRAGAAAVGTPCTVTVTQPPSLEADTLSSNVTIPCSFSTNGCPGSSPTVLWFRYLADTHEDLCTPKCTQNKKFQVTGIVPEKQASLQIINANTEDSAIYFCGVAFGDSADPLSKQTGGGTALTVRESKKYSAGVYVMAVVLVLLIIYIAAVFTSFKVFSEVYQILQDQAELNAQLYFKSLIIFVSLFWTHSSLSIFFLKLRCLKPITILQPKAKETKREGHKTNIKGSGQSISRAIAQELRKKKNKLNRRPQLRLEKETIYQNK